MAEIEIRGLSLTLGGKRVLQEVNLTAEDGEMFVLCGPSGAGKTSLLRVVAGETEADAGEILMDGKNLPDIPARERRIVMVDQMNRLFGHMTIRQNTEFPMKIRHVPKAERKRWTAELAERFHLGEQLDLYPEQLSGGQQKLAAIMRALAADPRALLLDEPFAGMDRPLHLEIRNFMAELQKERRITTVLVTHSREDAFTLGNRIAVMLGGSIRLQANRESVPEAAEDPEVREFLGKRVTLPDGRWVFADSVMTGYRNKAEDKRWK